MGGVSLMRAMRMYGPGVPLRPERVAAPRPADGEAPARWSEVVPRGRLTDAERWRVAAVRRRHER